MSGLEAEERGFELLIKTGRYPSSWCPGCGIGLILNAMASSLLELGLDRASAVAVSGIGCSGRLAGYLNLDSVHTPHGRALPLAEAIHMVNPEIKVVVASGDGDLASIGGNHLLHSARRNPDISVFCVNNQVYGLTGGQVSPTTPTGVPTITTPQGNAHNPVSLQRIVTANVAFFFARTTVYHLDHMQKCMVEAIKWSGFSFVEIVSDCCEILGRRLGYKTPFGQLADYRDHYRLTQGVSETLEENELGIMQRVIAP